MTHKINDIKYQKNPITVNLLRQTMNKKVTYFTSGNVLIDLTDKEVRKIKKDQQIKTDIHLDHGDFVHFVGKTVVLSGQIA